MHFLCQVIFSSGPFALASKPGFTGRVVLAGAGGFAQCGRCACVKKVTYLTYYISYALFFNIGAIGLNSISDSVDGFLANIVHKTLIVCLF